MTRTEWATAERVARTKGEYKFKDGATLYYHGNGEFSLYSEYNSCIRVGTARDMIRIFVD